MKTWVSQQLPRLVYLAIIMMLSSCAIQPGQQDANVDAEEKTEEPEVPQVVIVEPGVQKLFDDAIGMLKSENYEDAITLLDQVVAQEKRLAAPYVNLAIANEKLGKDKKAREHIEAAIKAEANDAAANNALGLMLRREGKFEDAKKAYLKVIEKHPEYLPAIVNLGILCDIYLRDWDCALEQYERAQELRPDDKLKIWIADTKRR